MKKNFYILSLLSLFISCNLDIPVEDEISGYKVIDNPDIAREALASAYNSFPQTQMYFSILVDQLIPTYLINNDIAIKNIYKWKPSQIAQISNDLWQKYYNCLAELNLIIISYEDILTPKNSIDMQWQIIYAQALALKSYVYFQLLNIYSLTYDKNQKLDGIIMKDDLIIKKGERQSQQNCVNKIDKLLSKAEKILLNQEVNINYFSYSACLLLHAKTMLYAQNYQKSIYYASQLINYKGNTSLDEYQNLWNNKDCKENQLAFYNQQIPMNEFNEDILVGDKFFLSDKIKFHPDDLRNNASIIYFPMNRNNSVDKIERPLIAKYRSVISDKKPKNISHLRFAESYFVIAEAYAKLNNNNKAIQYINTLLNSRGAPQINNSPNILLEIILQKEKEFIGEGLSYFDFKRNKMKINRYAIDRQYSINTINAEDYRWTFPIPYSEIKYNENVNQNPEWETIINII